MDELVGQFRAVTGSDVQTAEHFLGISDSHLQTAIELFYVQSPAENSLPSSSKADTSSVRAPIPRKNTVLVNESFQTSYAPPKRPNTNNSVFDAFRDFKAETAEQTRLIKEATKNTGAGPSNGASRSNESLSAQAQNEATKRKTLESLFRPPLEMMHRGTFEMAKQEAVKEKRWLLVNVQNMTEFACQALNRDIWNHQMVKDLISGNFVFWQIYCDSSDGNRFCVYYPVTVFPFVCAIDPSTGEMVEVFRNTKDTVAFCDSVVNFLERRVNPINEKVAPEKNHLANGASATTSKNANLDTKVSCLKRKLLDNTKQQADLSSSKSAKLTQSPEAAHLVQNGLPCDSSENMQIWSDFVSSTGRELLIMFRLPNGTKHMVKMNADSKLKAILIYAQSELKCSASAYNYVLNYPRRILNDLDPMQNLVDLNLNAQEIIYVEQR